MDEEIKLEVVSNVDTKEIETALESRCKKYSTNITIWS